MKKSNDFVTKNVADENRVVLNGVEMERDEHGNYHKVSKRPQRFSLLPLAAVAMFMAISSLFLAVTSLSNRPQPTTKTITGSLSAEMFQEHIVQSLETVDTDKGDDDSTYYTLTIHYIGTSGEELCPATQKKLKCGDTYSVASPTLPGYVSDQSTTSGVMSNGDQTRNVNYDKR